MRYTGDVLISTQHAIRDRLAFIVWPAGGSPTYVLCAVEEGYVRQQSWIGDVRSYVEFVTHPIDVLADLLTELGIAKGRVAMEVEYLASAYRDRLLARLPGLVIEPAEPIFRRARMLKSPREVATLQRGYRGTASAMEDTYKAAASATTNTACRATSPTGSCAPAPRRSPSTTSTPAPTPASRTPRPAATRCRRATSSRPIPAATTTTTIPTSAAPRRWARRPPRRSTSGSASGRCTTRSPRCCGRATRARSSSHAPRCCTRKTASPSPTRTTGTRSASKSTSTR